MTVEVQDPVQNHAEPSATTLVGGIIGDVHELVEQQFRLTRREIEEDLSKGMVSALVFGLGVGLFFLGVGVLGLAVVYLLHWGAAPAGTDPAWFPLWACHAVVGAWLSILGGVLAGVGRMLFNSISPMKNPAKEPLKENIAWATAPK
jgi:hypothetical protein